MQYRNTTYAEDVFDTYWFEKNMQGDIVAVYDVAGTLLISYLYDAWGNVTTTYSNGGASTNAAYNPFKYRGYYHDSETGWYYLQSRYYNSAWGRFISADEADYLGANGDLISYNLFAYCSNNPVMYTDPSGHFVFTTFLICAAVGMAVGFAATVYADYADDGEVFNGSVSGEGYVVNTLVGGLVGGTAYLAAPAIGSFLTSSFTIGSYALAGGEVVAITVSGAEIAGAAGIAGIIYFSKPNSGRIRFNDGTGINPDTGKEFTNEDEARNYYKSLKDKQKKNKWKKWLKSKGWYRNHIK